MLKKRVIAVVIIRDGGVVQSEGFKHTHVIHSDAFHAVEAFNRWAVDEIILLNVSLSRKSRTDFLAIVERVSKTCFIPLTVGGWIDTEEYGAKLIENGADKLIINTAWELNVAVPRCLSQRFGKQCIVASIDVKSINGKKEVHIDRGRQHLKLSPLYWAQHCIKNGAGEVFINNIEHDGLRKGYDLETITLLAQGISVPVIAFGGVFNWEHMAEGLDAGADAVAAANIFHYKELAAKQAKRYLARKGFNLRKVI